MTRTDTTLDNWQEHLDDGRIEQVERQLVNKHDGDVTVLPSALAASILGDYLSRLEDDMDAREVDQRTYVNYVYAKCLDGCVHDDWNGRHK